MEKEDACWKEERILSINGCQVGFGSTVLYFMILFLTLQEVD